MPEDDQKAKHIALTKLRARAFKSLFGDKPDQIFPFHAFSDAHNAPLIDVFVYPFFSPEMSGRVVAAVTNGMSDHAMPDGRRCELIQYLRECDYDHAARIYDLAWLPNADDFALGPFETITLPDAVDPATNLRSALFLPPIITPHREFKMTVEGDEVSLLWYVPITMKELEFKKDHGLEALMARMEAVELPWVFDEMERPDLL